MINLNQKKSIAGGIIALLIATSCCWLPFIIIALGGASGWMAFSDGLEQYSGLFMLIGLSFLAYAGYLFWKKRKSSLMKNEVILDSVITCPECNFQSKEEMPTNACQYFYECSNCKKVLKPNKGDCCVYCSFGTVPCPPIQLDQNCC